MKLSIHPIRAVLNFAVVTASLLIIAVCAHADIKVVQNSVMDTSKMLINGEPLTDQMKQMLAKQPMFQGVGTSTTTYLKGTKARMEMDKSVFLSDSATKTVTVLDKTAKTYYTESFSDQNGNQPFSKMTVKVTDLGTTQVILGYTCHGYDVTMSGGDMPMTFDSTVWAAPDFALPEGISSGNPQIDAFKGKIIGYPLKMACNTTSPIFGSATLTMTVTAISTDALDDSLFTVPADYTLTTAPKVSRHGKF